MRADITSLLRRRTGLVIAGLAVVAVSCGGDHHDPESTPARDPMAVQTTEVRAADADGLVAVGGLVQPRTSAVLTSRIMAPVREVRVAPGDRVRAGQVLVTLDGAALAAEARRAADGVAAAREGRAALDAERQAAAAHLELARASHGRIAALHARKSATPQELDEAAAQLKAAEARAGVLDARAREADAALASASAGRDAAQVTAGYAAITAPFAGTVTEKLIEPGNTAMPGAPLLRLEAAGGHTLDVRVDAARITTLAPGDEVAVVIDADAERRVTGRVREVARAMQADGRAFEVRIDLPEDPALRAGMFGRALLPGDPSSALSVPASALQRAGQVTSVFVVDGDVARRRMVVAGGTLPDDRVQLLSGIAAGERVVVAPPATLSDGAPIREGGTQ